MFLSMEEIGIRDAAVFKSVINQLKQRVKGVKIATGLVNKKINEEAMNKLEELNIQDAELKNLDFLKYFKNVKSLYISRVSGLENIDGIGYLDRLDDLGFSFTHVNDLSPVGMCTSIEEFEYSLGNQKKTCEDIDFSFLYGLPKLRAVDVTDCGIKDISFLSNCTGIEEVLLCDNPINSTYTLTKLTKLNFIDIEKCGLTEIEGIEEFAENECLEKFLANDNNFSADKAEYYKNKLCRLEKAEF